MRQPITLRTNAATTHPNAPDLFITAPLSRRVSVHAHCSRRISVGALASGIAADAFGAETIVMLFVTLLFVVIGAAWARSATLRDVTLSRLIAGDKR